MPRRRLKAVLGRRGLRVEPLEDRRLLAAFDVLVYSETAGFRHASIDEGAVGEHPADGDNGGFVNDADYSLWAENFGATGPACLVRRRSCTAANRPGLAAADRSGDRVDG